MTKRYNGRCENPACPFQDLQVLGWTATYSKCPQCGDRMKWEADD
jgi:hypothetical protein